MLILNTRAVFKDRRILPVIRQVMLGNDEWPSNEYYLEYLSVHHDFTMCYVDEKAYQLFRELVHLFK